MITLEQAKAHLRVDFDTEDADINMRLILAVSIVADYLGSTFTATDSQSLNVVDAATLLVFGELYANRESTANPLSPTVRALLDRLRVPVVA